MFLFSFFPFFLYFLSSNSTENESRFYVLPLTEFNLETPSNLYTNLVLTNPIETPIAASPTTTTVLSTNQQNSSPKFAQNNVNIQTAQKNYSNQSSTSAMPPMSYTTTSLTSPLKGTIPKLQREETQNIPIPGRAQSHDDIRMIGSGSGYSSPSGSNYCISPVSPKGQFFGSSPVGMGMSSSPPVSYYGNSHLGVAGGAPMVRRVMSRAASPLSSSVSSNSGIYNKNSSSNSRYNVNTSSNRSESNIS